MQISLLKDDITNIYAQLISNKIYVYNLTISTIISL